MLAAGLAAAALTGPSHAAAPPKAARAAGAQRAPAPAALQPAVPKAPVLLSISVQPVEFTLAGPRSERQLLVTGKFSDGAERDLTDAGKYVPLNPKTVRVGPSGLVSPLADGEAKVKVTVGKFTGTAKATVKETAKSVPVSFKNDVVPILTKAGCNQGACHGAQLGKGGFKLSLLGFDPDADFATVVKQSEGRRVALTDPESSLFLLKPTMGVPHGGGMRLKPGSYEYGLLLSWLQDGAPAPVAEETAVTRIEVLPARRVVKLHGAAGAKETVAVPQVKGPPQLLKLAPAQRLAAVATFKDGSTEDVTRKAQFNSLNDTVVGVDEGLVSTAARGEAAVMVRYRGQATISRFTIPYRELASFPEVAKANYIDERVAAKWQEMGLLPSARCTDAEFIRRAYLDVLGVLPTPDELRAFLTSADPKKREKLVDAVLSRPEYVDYWTLKWGDLLRNNRDRLGEKGMWSFYNWMRASFRENRPMDQFARELVTAQGSTYTTGPANFFREPGGAPNMAETTAQVFLGVRLACARCHHHPYEKWSQDDYWQMAAFFARVGVKSSQEFGLYGGEQVVRLLPNGEMGNPRTGKIMKPTPLDGEPMDDPIDRRRPLAAWMTGPDNTLFARNLVNRYWGYLMGRGIVEPVDDMRVTNLPSNGELLDALAKDFITHKYDVKYLLRTIMTSEVYQLSSDPTPENKQDEVFCTKYAVKRMAAEELLDALNFATGATDKFPNLPAGKRAVQLPDPGVNSYFLDTFGRPARVVVCECERTAEPNMAQALHLMNSDYVQNKVAAGDGRIAKLLAAKKSDEEMVEELYLVTFSRPPSPEEQARALLSVAKAPSKKEGLEDLLWALLNSREFLFKH
jgi:hypothetical protein